MTNITYTNYTNVSSTYRAGYRPGDCLIEGWSGTMPIDAATVVDPAAIAELIFERHNRDDRPDGQLCPSMSVGDVTVIGEVVLTIEPVGFRECVLDATDIDRTRTWTQWAAAR